MRAEPLPPDNSQYSFAQHTEFITLSKKGGHGLTISISDKKCPYSSLINASVS